jgi:hypothetical protein
MNRKKVYNTTRGENKRSTFPEADKERSGSGGEEVEERKWRRGSGGEEVEERK